MSVLSLALAPLRAPAVLTGVKSFRGNPVIGSARLNRIGLHTARIRLAERMAEARRRRLRHLLDAEDAAALDRDGFVLRRNALSPDAFAALRAEAARPLPAREMRQGAAVTRFIDLPPSVLAQAPALAGLVRGPLFRGLLAYGAATARAPIYYLHTVITDPGDGPQDPQTNFHADTFHATAKGWLFLEDVAVEDGPFRYVPGSHRLTPARLAWEHAQSVVASEAPDHHHADGSFRASEAELRDMGYPEPVSFAVQANTLVVADTHGFHARGPSLRPSVRPAVYGSLRRNPFLPWTGLDPFSLPPLKERETLLFGALLDLESRLSGRPPSQPRVGAAAATDPTPRL